MQVVRPRVVVGEEMFVINESKRSLYAALQSQLEKLTLGVFDVGYLVDGRTP